MPGPALPGTPHAGARGVLSLSPSRRLELQDRDAALGAGDRGALREAVDPSRARGHSRLDTRAPVLSRARDEDRLPLTRGVTGHPRRGAVAAPSPARYAVPAAFPRPPAPVFQVWSRSVRLLRRIGPGKGRSAAP